MSGITRQPQDSLTTPNELPPSYTEINTMAASGTSAAAAEGETMVSVEEEEEDQDSGAAQQSRFKSTFV